MHKYLGDILCSNKHGFRKNLSCDTQLITTIHGLSQIIDNGDCVQMATLDFAKAFDKVSHQLLVEKMQAYKVPSQIVRWVKSFLEAQTHGW